MKSKVWKDDRVTNTGCNVKSVKRLWWCSLIVENKVHRSLWLWKRFPMFIWNRLLELGIHLACTGRSSLPDVVHRVDSDIKNYRVPRFWSSLSLWFQRGKARPWWIHRCMNSVHYHKYEWVSGNLMARTLEYMTPELLCHYLYNYQKLKSTLCVCRRLL